jgi:hypothetical protein
MTPKGEAYTDGRERLGFVDAHGAFYLQLDGKPTGLAVFGVYDAAILRGQLIACPARPGGWGNFAPPLFLYQGEGKWVSLRSCDERDALVARLEGAVHDLAHLAQVVHQGYHDEQEGTYATCTRGICAATRRAIARGKGAG